ncbi:DUF695 domain-containing protein [Achromobacter sp. UMC46]|uniref:DUF695 domain-containing protein n=1 Tax=Achromobacter sp. UMC46 TaxID=1862319 RepID=UPI0015FF7E74|nr:DUF695 domain-containing protein [Achromobacter sp. UMC46]
MPNDEDKKNTNSFEEAIEKGFENSDIGVQVACLTGNHLKEWRYYTVDVEAFLDAFNACLAGHPAYPIQLRTYTDPDWNTLSELQQKAQNRFIENVRRRQRPLAGLCARRGQHGLRAYGRAN